MNNFTIKFKLYALAIVVSICLIALFIVTLNASSQMKALNNTFSLIQKSEVEMLTLRRNEKDFLARLDVKYQQKFATNFVQLANHVNQIRNNLESLGLGDKESLIKLVQQLQEYKVGFTQIVDIHQLIGLNHDQGLRGSLRSSVREAEEKLKQSNSLQLIADMLMLRRNEKDFMLRKDNKYIDKFKENFTIFKQHLTDSVLDFATKKDIDTKMAAYRSTFMKLKLGYQKLGLTSKEGLHGEMRSKVHKTEAIFKALETRLSKNITTQNSNIYNNLLYITAAFIILIVVSILSISYSINKRLGSLTHHLNDFALKSGDLSAAIQITGKDEITVISQLFNQFIANLRKTFIEIPVLSENLQQVSKGNSIVSQKTNQLAVEQQSESEQLAEFIQQMLSTTTEVTRNIHIAADLASVTNKSVIVGKKTIKGISDSVNLLANKLQLSAETTQNLESDSHNIRAVLDVIRAIAEQTNLLALNAAIEAARAGENGRGFAVVADEVRALAKRTQDSTMQIEALIESFQLNVKNTIDAMREGAKEASDTAKQTLDANETLDTISSAVNQIFELNSNIAVASEEQEAISNDITTNIQHINKMAKETSQQANETNQSSSQIEDIASNLQSLVAVYRF
ncbi:MAG: methyl-accepting chemotaxis protein [Colwellia sp.]|nr:methyl-accepting chemotaxis protein [Colwellia sp.]